MPELKHHELDLFLSSASNQAFPRAILIWGQDYLVRSSFEKILNALLTKKEKEISYQLLEGVEASVSAIIERLMTYTLMTDKQVIAVKDAPILPAPGITGYTKEEIEALDGTIKKGFPEGHFLILTVSSMDKRRSLFKTMKEVGIVLDCSVPIGNRQADKNEQTAILNRLLDETLRASGKSIDKDAVNQFIEMIGFDPAILVENINKLISYSGSRQRISTHDVATVVRKTKKDAVYELTNALGEKNLSRSLYFLDSLLSGEFHPLQALAAIGNQIRRLALVKQFIETCQEQGVRCWHPKIDFNWFKNQTLPEIEKADASVLKRIQSWNQMLNPDEDLVKQSKSKVSTDLFIAPNPKNPYPVYQLFLKSDNFSYQELSNAIIAVNDVDFKLKSSGSDPDILLENLLIRICNTGGPDDSKN